MQTPFLELRNITKTFPGVRALENVSLQVYPGQVLALIGENGAGKSTLMKIIGGVHQADTGEVLVQGKAVEIKSAVGAMAQGIAFIHQELNVLDNLDVGSNIYLGREPTKGGPLKWVDRKAIDEGSRVHLKRLGLNVSPRTPLKELSLAQQQLVEIAKALSQNAKVLIMDEPTSCLTLSETEYLLRLVRELRDSGVAVIYITHRMGEIITCADRVVALRDGKNAGELAKGEITHEAMVKLMVGRAIKAMHGVGGARKDGANCLSVKNLRTRANPHATVSFEAYSGEILGFAGLVGAGRSEVAQTLFGVDPPLEGEVSLNGKGLKIRSARDAIRAGLYLAPEDRRKTGLVLDMTVRENVTLPDLAKYSRFSWIRRAAENVVAEEQVKALKVKTASIETRPANLSGGNQQKIVLGKWMAMAPKVLIFDEPTRGIDVGAKAEIYTLMRRLAESGVVIIMISSDMEEVLSVSDRIAVMHEGRISGFLEHSEFSEEAVMGLAVGKAKRKAS